MGVSSAATRNTQTHNFKGARIPPEMHTFCGLRIEEWAAIINLIVVTVLAVINFFYMKSAKKQATESQRQADAAMESLRLLKAQTEAQNAQELVRAITILHAVMSDVMIWLDVIEKHQWGIPPLTVKLLPDDWSVVVYQTGKVSASLRTDVNSLEKFLTDANSQISQFLARPIESRGEQLLREAQPNLELAATYLSKIIETLEAPETDRPK